MEKKITIKETDLENLSLIIDWYKNDIQNNHFFSQWDRNKLIDIQEMLDRFIYEFYENKEDKEVINGNCKN